MCRGLREVEETSPEDLWGRALEDEERVNGKCMGNEYTSESVCNEFSTVSGKWPSALDVAKCKPLRPGLQAFRGQLIHAHLERPHQYYANQGSEPQVPVEMSREQGTEGWHRWSSMENEAKEPGYEG